MSYRVGIDVGTTFTAAAIHRNGRAEIFPLSERRIVAPTMVARDDAGRLLVGWAAASQLRDHPERVVHSFKRRIGDRTPLPLGDREYEPSWFMAQILSAVVTEITRVAGEAPNRITLTHPANWNARKIASLLRAASTAGLTADAIILMSEPEAAAVAHAATSTVEEGSMLAVYDLGGGSFDTGVLRRTGGEYEIVGLPEGVDRLGGLDFDATLYRYAVDQLRRRLPSIDPSDESTGRALSQLHLDCVLAKESLSFDEQTFLSLTLDGRSAETTIERQSFEALIRPALMETISALRRCLNSARMHASDLDEILLTGGSSQIPLVAELLATELGRPVSVHPTPKELVALGAAVAAAKADGADRAEAIDDLGDAPTPDETSPHHPASPHDPVDPVELIAPITGNRHADGHSDGNANGRAADVDVPPRQAAARADSPIIDGFAARPAVPRVELDAATAVERTEPALLADGAGLGPPSTPGGASPGPSAGQGARVRFHEPARHGAAVAEPDELLFTPSGPAGDRLSLVIGMVGAVALVVIVAAILLLVSS